ncbi:MAG: CapA family protein [Candidatus Kerfeldbacteria bacterium]|nr:CapA family protein [Candidatus Kerfeldbacteria bacterium]
MKKYGRALIVVSIFMLMSLRTDGAPTIKKIRDVSFTDITHDQVTVQWTPPAGSNLRYRVWLKDTSGNTLAKRRTQQTSIVLTHLYPETKYYIKVRAVRSSHVTGKWSIAQSFTTVAKPPVMTTAIFAGDVMLSRHVARATESTGNMAAPFANIADEFKQNDLAFINLEAPFKEYGPWDVPDEAMTFKVNPRMLEGLQLAGIDLVSLANNHIYNAGQAGVDYTKQYLVDSGIAYCLEHWDIREVNGLQFAFLCYSYDLNLDTNKLIADIQEVQDQGADVIIVSMHNGAEYTETISSSQSNFAHTAIDYGADLVIGHHPHVVQRMEEYQGKYIFYSLGNLIFDQDWSWPTQLGAVVKVTWEDDQVKKIEFKPIKIDADFQPRFMDFEEGKEVLGRLQVSNYELMVD